MPLTPKVKLPFSKEARFIDAIYSFVMTVPTAALLTFFSTAILKNYGWSLFIGVPFAVGMASAYLYGRNHLRSLPECLLVATLALTLLGIGIFAWLWEGIGCLIMAAPLGYALGIMGALLGYNLQKKNKA